MQYIIVGYRDCEGIAMFSLHKNYWMDPPTLEPTAGCCCGCGAVWKTGVSAFNRSRRGGVTPQSQMTMAIHVLSASEPNTSHWDNLLFSRTQGTTFCRGRQHLGQLTPLIQYPKKRFRSPITIVTPQTPPTRTDEFNGRSHHEHCHDISLFRIPSLTSSPVQYA